MKKRFLSLFMVAVLGTSILTGCGAKKTEPPKNENVETNTTDTSKTDNSNTKKEVLEFYHGYHHDESEWAPAKAMRDIYDEFTKQHADGPVDFKAIATEDVQGTVNNMVAGGSYPDIIDLAGNSLSLAAITQNLLYDMKPYIDAESIQTKVGLNYEQNDISGKIYTVHDQLLTIGFWYNEKKIKDAGASLPNTWANWDDFQVSMNTVREKGTDGNYAYGAGQGSARCFNAMLGITGKGADMIAQELSVDTINSKEFADSFKNIAKLDQENGSANASSKSNDWAADFNTGKSAIFFNGVWAAGGFGEIEGFKPAIYPGNVALSSAGGGITIANNMSEEKTKLALEFVKYMTSDEVQTKIFTQVGANPCNKDLDLAKLAEGANAGTVLLAEACSLANNAQTIVATIDATWGTDIANAIANKLVECTVSGVDIDTKFEELRNELISLIG